MRRFYVILPLLLLIASSSSKAGVIDFEGFVDSTNLTTQYTGLTFSNTIILSAGIGINELEFPPHSGTNIASDNGGPISITLDSPALGFAGYFTYAEPLTIQALDASNTQVAIITSAFSSNDALFGDPGSSPNEFLQVSFAGGISTIIITGDPGGGSFVLDDASIVPEPSTLLLLAIATSLAAVLRRRAGNHQ